MSSPLISPRLASSHVHKLQQNRSHARARGWGSDAPRVCTAARECKKRGYSIWGEGPPRYASSRPALRTARHRGSVRDAGWAGTRGVGVLGVFGLLARGPVSAVTSCGVMLYHVSCIMDEVVISDQRSVISEACPNRVLHLYATHGLAGAGAGSVTSHQCARQCISVGSHGPQGLKTTCRVSSTRL